MIDWPRRRSVNKPLSSKTSSFSCDINSAKCHTGGHFVEADAVDVEAAVAEVAEEHLVVVGGLLARAARLALGALPRVLAALADRVRAQLQA